MISGKCDESSEGLALLQCEANAGRRLCGCVGVARSRYARRDRWMGRGRERSAARQFIQMVENRPMGMQSTNSGSVSEGA